MDRSLDEIINSRDAPRGRGRRPRGDNHSAAPRMDAARAPRRDDFPRDGVRKSYRDNGRDIDRDWVHDKYEDEDAGRPARRPRNDRYSRHSPEQSREDVAPKVIRADNLHYDLTENDLNGLFSRIGRVQNIRLLYDRADRSQGIAFITYVHPEDARDAMREFDGANAMGQPLRLSLQNGSSTKPSRNPFDTAERPTRSLFDRIEGDERRGGGGRRRGRSASPRRAPENVDRYVPGARGRGSRSPRRRGGREFGRAPGARREERPKRGGGRGGAGGAQNTEGRPAAQGRVRKTAEELDAEMDSYWTNTAGAGAEDGQAAEGRDDQISTAPQTQNPAAGTTSAMDDDIDLMVE
ncbi:hypothetical protein AAFC00_000133 [Neodothiora populina]|uniref:RRM domain-containing protein n=1 Tax=Neodothiora populina TaxID=2781224 RepID=A0ABR3P1Q3_9PEZI